MDMREQKFGIEVELTGITRCKAATIAGKLFGSTYERTHGTYDTYVVPDAQGRKWKFMYDSSIVAVDANGDRAGDIYKVEMVSPICEYKDIPLIQEIVKQLRRAGAVAGETCGIHVHVNAAPHNARTLRNITNIMYCKEDLIYKALQVDVARENRYCQKVEDDFLEDLNRKKPTTLDGVKYIWYKGEDGSHKHYHKSRYHCLNLHSVFQKGTIEFRLFNSTTDTEKIKAYIQLCLAISAQALNQTCAGTRKTASTNEKYTFRTWLLRLGMIGDEFAGARKVLLEHLEGGIAWKDPAQAERQKERLRAKKEAQERGGQAQNAGLSPQEGGDTGELGGSEETDTEQADAEETMAQGMRQTL